MATNQPDPRKKGARPKPKLDDESKNVVSYNQQTRAGDTFDPTRESNFFTDHMRNYSNFLGEFVNPGRRNTIGGGFGDYMFGSNPADAASGLLGSYRDGKRPQGDGMKRVGRIASGLDRFRTPVEEQAPMTLADYLKQAMSIVGGGEGGGGIPEANYDPQRQALRERAGEADSRLEAMYRQLRGSIEADAPVLQQGYQQAIDSTRQNAATAQEQTQAATDSANARNNEVLANLGIQQAQGNIIQQGNDLNTQTAQRMGDSAAKGQAATDRLVSNQQTALTHNTNIGNAAGLEGNLQRAANGSRLQALLAEIDMQEQQENQGIAAQNASMGQSGLGQQLQLAQWMMGQDTDERRYQDSLAMDAASMAAKGQQALPDLGTYLQALGIDPNDVAKNPGAYGSLFSALSKYGISA